MEPAARRQKILAAIVESYIRTGEPIGSKALTGENGLKVSSATVRNDMAELTDRGYIVQPHTSAGRIPTALGYRYYIDNVMKVTPLAERGRQFISETLTEHADSPENILQSAADLLSRLTDTIAFGTTPSGHDSRVRRLSFVQTGAHSAMVVLMASNSTIKTQMFRCDFVLTPELLEVFDRALNELCDGVRLEAVNRPFVQTAAARFGELSLFMPSVLTAIMDAAESAAQVRLCHSGYQKLLVEADQNPIAARRIMEFLQNERDLTRMLEHLPQSTAVTLGRENPRVELSSSAMISARYTVDGSPSGVLALLTPLRTDYARAIAILECTAQCVSEAIDELISDG